MVLPQGSQRALEALTPATGGRQMLSIIKSAHALPAKTIAHPFAQAPGDGARWASVAGDTTGGAAGKGWVALALQRRQAYTTTTDAPSASTAAALLRKPAAVPQAGVPAAMRVESAAVPAVDNIWATPNQGKEAPGAPASGAVMAGNNTSGKLSNETAGGGAVAGGAVAGGAVAGGAGTGGALLNRKSKKHRSVPPAELRRLLRRVLKGKGRGDSGSDSDSDSDSSSESDGGGRLVLGPGRKQSKKMAHAMAGYQLGLADAAAGGGGGGRSSAGRVGVRDEAQASPAAPRQCHCPPRSQGL